MLRNYETGKVRDYETTDDTKLQDLTNYTSYAENLQSANATPRRTPPAARATRRSARHAWRHSTDDRRHLHRGRSDRPGCASGADSRHYPTSEPCLRLAAYPGWSCVPRT